MRRALGTITHVATKEPVAALTFDDGPHAEYTPRLLDLLDKYQAKATFFVVGKAAHRHPELIRLTAQAGHDIGNHSWDHASFPLISSRRHLEQVLKCEKAIAPYGKKLFRPPYGHQNLLSRLDLRRMGYEVIAWNQLAHDWLDHDATWMSERLIRDVRPGDIILFHDQLFTGTDERYFDREPMLATVGTVLERLTPQFRFVTVSELLTYGRPRRENWYWKPDLNWLSKTRQAKTEDGQPTSGDLSGPTAAVS